MPACEPGSRRSRRFVQPPSVLAPDVWPRFGPAPPPGSAVFSVAKVDPSTGEIAGVFESVQPSDTDLGAKAPKDVKITGLWYAQLTQ
jgi:hypothetical protein